MEKATIENNTGLKPEYYEREVKRIKRTTGFFNNKIKPILENLEFDFPVSVVPNVSTCSVEIFMGIPPETGEDKTNYSEEEREKNYHKLIAGVVRQFGIKLEREFNEYSGTFYWKGVLDKLPKIDEEDFGGTVYVTLDDAPKSGCRIIQVEQISKTKKYKAECF